MSKEKWFASGLNIFHRELAFRAITVQWSEDVKPIIDLLNKGEAYNDKVGDLAARLGELKAAASDVLRCRVAGCTCCNSEACSDCPPCPHCRLKALIEPPAPPEEEIR